jgi:hypothetical protein
MPSLRRLVTTLSQQWLRFDPPPENVVHNVAPGQVFLRVFRFSAVTVIPPTLYTYREFNNTLTKKTVEVWEIAKCGGMNINYQPHTGTLHMHTILISISAYNFCSRPRVRYLSVSCVTVNCFPCSSCLYRPVLCQVSGVMRFWCSGRRHPGWPGVLVSGFRHKSNALSDIGEHGTGKDAHIPPSPIFL